MMNEDSLTLYLPHLFSFYVRNLMQSVLLSNVQTHTQFIRSKPWMSLCAFAIWSWNQWLETWEMVARQ